MKSNQIIDDALNLYRIEANKRESDAAHSGSHNDGGCSIMIREIAAYNCGRVGMIPEWLVPYIVEATNLADTEYAVFLRLQKKFGKK